MVLLSSSASAPTDPALSALHWGYPKYSHICSSKKQQPLGLPLPSCLRSTLKRCLPSPERVRTPVKAKEGL